LTSVTTSTTINLSNNKGVQDENNQQGSSRNHSLSGLRNMYGKNAKPIRPTNASQKESVMNMDASHIAEAQERLDAIIAHLNAGGELRLQYPLTIFRLPKKNVRGLTGADYFRMSVKEPGQVQQRWGSKWLWMTTPDTASLSAQAGRKPNFQ
jgi:hypothetical protein